MMKKTIFLLFFSINFMSLYSQNETQNLLPTKKGNKFFFGIETGIRTFNSAGHEYNFIREEATYYYGYNNRYSEMSYRVYSPSVSLKLEYRNLDNNLWFSAGIDNSFMSSVMGKLAGSQDQTSFFYIMTSENLSESYYYRVQEIQEVSNYIGVPISIMYSPLRSKSFKLYFKLGGDFNYKLSTKQNVIFADASMGKHEETILELFDKSSDFYATTTLGLGIQFGKRDKPNIRIEGNFPTIVLTPEVFGLMDHHFGGGGRISFILPLKF